MILFSRLAVHHGSYDPSQPKMLRALLLRCKYSSEHILINDLTAVMMMLWDMTDAVSIAYVCGDTADKAYTELSEGRGKIAAAKMGVDVLLWQLLASVAVPGLTIHLVVRKAWRVRGLALTATG